MKSLKVVIFLIVFMGLIIPGSVSAWDSGIRRWGETVTGENKIVLSNDLAGTLAGIVALATGTIGVIFLVLTVYAGILWMTAAGNDEKIGKAKKFFVDGVIGFVIAMSAFSITQLVTQRVVNATSNNATSSEGCCDFGGGDCAPSAGGDMATAKAQCELANGKWVTPSKK